MLQVRKLVLAVAAVTATAFTSSYTHALGLGDIAIKSSLNQPLDAEISLLEVRDLTAVEVKTRLASSEEFSKAGVDRQFFLTGLTFTPVIDAKGKNVIRVTSQQPVKEPYLNFLVEVIWPNGRLLREYTLLLDPPLYAPQQVIYAPQPAVTTAATRVQPTPRAARQPRAATSTASVVAPVSRTLQGDEYRVQRNDTLWEIAQRVQGGASVHQTMLAIQDLNPDAFIGGNINRMKSGQVLRLPSAQDLTRRSRAEAVAQFNQQNDNWRTGTAAPAIAERQLDATHRVEAGAAPAEIDQADSLRLVADAPGEAQQAADQGAGAGANALQDQLARNKELLDSARLENEELHSRLDDLSSQLNKLQRLIELKDNQLAQLQSAVDAPLAIAEAEGLADAELVDEELSSVPVAGVDGAADADSAAALASQPDTTDQQQLSESAEPLAAVVAETAQPEEAVAVESGAATETAVAAAAEVEAPAAAPVATEATTQEKDLVATVMDNPTLLAAAGGGAVLGLLFILLGLSRSRARKEAARYEEKLTTQAELEGVEGAELSSDQAAPLALDALDEPALGQEDDQLAAALAFDTAEPDTESQFKEEATDPIAEADSYIGFGRYNQAANVLTHALEQEPERIDLRHKLLEVYAELENQTGFSQQVNEITKIGGAATELAQIKADYPHMFGVEQVAVVSLQSDFADLKLDDLKFDEVAAATEETPSPIAELDAELDELSALLADAEATAPKQSTTADFDFDLDLDLDLSEPVESAAESTSPAQQDLTETRADDLLLDIDALDLDLELSAAQETAETSTAEEFSLDDLSQQLEETDFQLPDDFDFSIPETSDQGQKTTDFDLKLDEFNSEEETLSASSTTETVAESTQEIDSLLDSVLAEPAALTDEPAPLSNLSGLSDLENLEGIDDDFSFLSGTDETATKLDLARAYIDMGDSEGARDILEEVVAEGTTVQQDEARELVKQLG